MTDAPDTNELLLREVEAAVARARTAMNAEHWELVQLNIGFAAYQAWQLSSLLNSRIKVATADPLIMGF